MLDHNRLTQVREFQGKIGFLKENISMTDKWIDAEKIHFEYTNKHHSAEMVTYVSFPMSDFQLYCQENDLLNFTSEEFKFVPGEGAEIVERNLDVSIEDAFNDFLFDEEDLRGFLLAHLSYIQLGGRAKEIYPKLNDVTRRAYVKMKVTNEQRKKDGTSVGLSDQENRKKTQPRGNRAIVQKRKARIA